MTPSSLQPFIYPALSISPHVRHFISHVRTQRSKISLSVTWCTPHRSRRPKDKMLSLRLDIGI
ncbi:ORF_20 [Adoxophyes orana granulovirus]|uniref:ORF_20 n=1 Tax=Adoxophyes orana granulovirus TaxID=170617 RepID=Q7T9Z5_GVAO|nr:ORF_20 [Adoxophyes orana granulovirus]AAP85657.1 ORF_20 [Adoxophyes orana granulovirus]